VIRRSRQFSLSPRESVALRDSASDLTVCQEPKKSRINEAGYVVFCLLAFRLLPTAFCLCLLLWCPRRDSNPEPTDYETV
jgi:hypothetical protein